MTSPRFETAACLEGRTLIDPLTGQPMHSAIGPTREAEQIYIGPSRLAERLANPGDPLVLWDVGMGIAGNAAAVLALSGARNLEIHSFENQCDGLETALRDLDHFEHLKPVASAARELLSHGRAKVGQHTWHLHRGDFETALAGAPAAEVIFFDFYSPRVCGPLWSVPMMESLRLRCPRSTLVTYSAATPVRLALLLAGWWIGRPGKGAPVTALKNESTIAVADCRDVTRLGTPFGPEWMQKFRSSTQARPYPAGPQHPNDRWASASFEELEAELLRHPQMG